MSSDLSNIGMESGQQYETIVTTIDKNGSKNAAPVGVICKGKNDVMCRIFEGSTTLNNIISQKKFIVNITLNPVLFTFGTIGNIPENLFIDSKFDLPSLKNIDAYFKCDVTNIKETVKKNDPIRNSEAKIIIADVEEIILNNNCVKAPNRGFYSLIESLINFTRIDLVDDEQKDYFLSRFKESLRVINKVGSDKDKEAITILEKTLNDKGYKTN